MIKRKICVVITARPSYSRIKTALFSIKNNPKLELQLVVMGSALLDRYGSAVDYIEKDGLKIIAKVHNAIEGENLTSAAKTTGLGITELCSVFDKIKPDIVVTIADRFETISTAVTASFMNIPLAHMQGGEVTGNIDEKVRHAITKLSDYHLVSSEDANNRVIKLGEDPKSVFITGCPSIDIALKVKNIKKLNFDPYSKYGGVGAQPNYKKGYWVVLQHPVTTEINEARKHIEETLEAMKDLEETIFWFWPNIDAGSDGTSSGIRAFREKNHLKNFHFFKNMNPEDFLLLLLNSKGLIGNSSTGIRECSFLGVPVINIGSRQERRIRGKNIIEVKNYSSKDIFSAVEKINKSGKIESSYVYGGGDSGKKVSDVLEKVELKFKKTITY